MNKIPMKLQRAGFGVVAGFFLLALGVVTGFHSSVSADQVTTRSIQMSSSAAGATNVTYTLTFTPVHTLATAEIVVDFCDNSPLIGDTCTATAGTNVPDTTSVAFVSSSDCTGATTVTSAVPDNHTVKVTGCTTVSNSTPVNVKVNGITNPTNTGLNGGFYARILLYDTSSSYVPGTATTGTTPSDGLGATDDTGGAALSVVDNINITAKVFETLKFCVYNSAASGTCGTLPAITLGDATTGALSTANGYVNSDVAYEVATNAGSGVNVIMRGHTLCRNTTSATCDSYGNTTSVDTITPINTGSTTPLISTPGGEQFGMCVDGTGPLTPDATYKDTSAANCNGLGTGTYAGGAGTALFGFNADGTTGTTSPGGDVLMSSSAAVADTSSHFTFLGNIGATTEAGIYTTALNLVATSTY